MLRVIPQCLVLVGFASTVSGHIALYHNSMYGFNVTDNTFPYDNRPVVPMHDWTFDKWWLHGHIDYPPHDGDFLELPAGGTLNAELSCDKGATSWYASSPGGNAGYGSNWPCPGRDSSAFHTTGIDDVAGCALGIAYKSDVHDLRPEDFAILSVNHTCVWYLNTAFDIPELPACPEGGCHCGWFWIHSKNSGSSEMFMNAYKCRVTGNTGSRPIGKPAVPRRCGADGPEKPEAVPGNCTVGAKQAMYWDQHEGNNMFEGTYQPPHYNELYGFHNGAQHDIFEDGVIASLKSEGAAPAVQTSAPDSTPPTSNPSSSDTTIDSAPNARVQSGGSPSPFSASTSSPPASATPETGSARKSINPPSAKVANADNGKADHDKRHIASPHTGNTRRRHHARQGHLHH